MAETALVGSIQKFSVEDGPGIRTTVFLKGCPLNCRWCHNPELIDAHQQLMLSPRNCIRCGGCIEVCPQGALSMGEDGIVVDRAACDVCLACTEACYARALRPVAHEMSVADVMAEALQDRDFYANSGGGITISGGEVLAHAAFVGALVDAAASERIGVCLDTCGLGDSETLLELAARQNVTHVLFDLKADDDALHRECTGVGNVAILANLRMLAADARTAGKLVVRMPLVAGVNDGDGAIRAAVALLREIRVKHVDLLPYHRLGVGKMRNIGGIQEEFEAPEEARVDEIAALLEREVGCEVGVLGKV